MNATVQQSRISATVQEETRLNHIIAIYVPRNSAQDEPIVESVAREFSVEFGGASVEEIQGYWVNSEGDLIRDLIARIYSFHNDAAAAESIARIIAARVKIKLNQDSILIESDGTAILL